MTAATARLARFGYSLARHDYFGLGETGNLSGSDVMASMLGTDVNPALTKLGELFGRGEGQTAGNWVQGAAQVVKDSANITTAREYQGWLKNLGTVLSDKVETWEAALERGNLPADKARDLSRFVKEAKGILSDFGVDAETRYVWGGKMPDVSTAEGRQALGERVGRYSSWFERPLEHSRAIENMDEEHVGVLDRISGADGRLLDGWRGALKRIDRARAGHDVAPKVEGRSVYDAVTGASRLPFERE